jgi:DNA topoisomerase I
MWAGLESAVGGYGGAVPRRLRRVSPDSPGWTRRRHGSGFVYFDEHGRRLGVADVARCKGLVIPPAWRDVWICPLENGHLQAVGTDDAGRRQYLYHPDWRAKRDRAKHDRVLEVGDRLPRARSRVDEYLGLEGMPRARALAAAFRLLDLGLFRVGGESYADTNGSYGLATIEKRHVRIDGDSMTFSFPAKSGQRHRVTVTDPAVRKVIAVLRRRRGGGPQLLAYREGRRWRDISSRDINEFVKDIVGGDVSAKDFRTWHGTVTAAVSLADNADAGSAKARRRAVRRAAEAVSDQLGNTPSVARKSYIDPRVVDRFEAGETITPPRQAGTERSRRRAESEVLRLLED